MGVLPERSKQRQRTGPARIKTTSRWVVGVWGHLFADGPRGELRPNKDTGKTLPHVCASNGAAISNQTPLPAALGLWYSVLAPENEALGALH